MRWRNYVVGAAAIAILAWSAIALAQNLVEREARAMLDGWVRTPPAPFTTFNYGAVRFDFAERRLVITDIELTGASDVERIAIETVVVVDPQPFALDNVINPARYRGGRGQGDFAQVASRIEVRAIEVTASDGEATIATVATGAVALRQFAEAPTAQDLGGDIGKVVGIIMPGIRADEITINSLAWRQDSGGTSIARVSVRGVDAGRVAQVRIEDLRLVDKEEDVESDAVTIGAFTVTGIDLSRALPDMAAGRPMSATDPERKPQFDRWELRTLGGPALAVHGVSLERMGAEVSRPADRATERVDFYAEGISLAAPTDPESPMARILSGLGYPALTGTIACVSNSDNIRKRWTMEPCALSFPGAGTLSLTYVISGLDVSAPANADGAQALMESLAAASLDWIRLGFKDDGLTDRAIAHGSQSAGQPDEAFRRALVAQIRDGAEAYGGGSPRVRRVVDAVSAFIDRPGALTVALEPNKPVAFGSLDFGLLADPAAAADRLGLTGTHAR
ncbi:MAG TPA: hypothetical protein VJR58_16970 [Vineibacter sp.]|nr:hypothetical protein [Vineibacter sp.]